MRHKVTTGKEDKTTNVQLEDTVNHNPWLDDDELLILAQGQKEAMTALLKLRQNKIMCHSFFFFFFLVAPFYYIQL